MALNNTWVEWAVRQAVGDKTLMKAIDTVVRDAPIMAVMQFYATSNGFLDVYEVIKTVDGMEQTDLDAPIPEIDIASDIKQISLNSFAGKIVAGLDKLNRLGKTIGDYVSDIIPKHTGRTMERMEKTWIDMARAYALQNAAIDPATQTRVIDAGGDSNTNYTLLSVRWEQDNLSGIFDPKGFGTGKIFEEIPLWKGGVGEDTDGVAQYGVILKNYSGFKFANPDNVGAIVNIDKASVPTEEQLGDIIDDTRANMVLVHPKMARAIGISLGLSRMEYHIGDTDLVQSFLTIDGIPLVTSRQFLRGTEPNVVVPT